MNLSRLVLAAALALTLVLACRPTQVLTPSRTSHSFGSVYVGTTATSPAVTWKNVGLQTVSTNSLLPTPIGGPFTASPAFTGQTLTPGQSSTAFTFTFAPTAAGQVRGSAALGIRQTQHQVQPVELDGFGIIQIAGGSIGIGGGDLVADEILDFGDVVVPGGPPVDKRFNLYNRIGNQPVRLESLWFAGGDGFSIVSPAFPVTIPAQGRVPVTIRFNPTAVGEYADGITFQQNVLIPTHYGGTAVKGRGVAPN